MRRRIEATLKPQVGPRGWLVWDCLCYVREFDTWREAMDHALTCGGSE